MNKPLDPRRGEIWLVDLEPARGSEIQKVRPVVVLSTNTIRALQVRVVVPLTGWQDHFASTPWKVRIEPESRNALTKPSAADGLQLRCFSLERFSERRGSLSKSQVEEIIAAINYCLEE